ncbi:YfdQ family protein [Pseudohongiella spirulinae]|uniref:DUF2303 family protein n=1 Tax=Pseudohongiella spirulinae TaxID=1249552 RepID=A0A0S2KE49_9GAMM|nr:DUF2303 family protein [Pseudohongiella spirulinae]ALO46604.1 hypothetical protein PS2015_1962 [Pseudohongiella spirulinae]
MKEAFLDTEFGAAHALGAATDLVINDIEGVPHVLVPPGSSLENMEKLLPAPTRIREHPEFADIAGFADYVEEFKQVGSRVFVDETALRFVTVFDFHAPDAPAWCDHSASIKMNLAPEWERFTRFDSKAMSPREFAEFLEDNVAYVDSEASGMTGADLLTMAQTFKVNIKGDIEVEETLSRGLRKMVIKDDSTLRGQNKDGKELEFPEKLYFTLRIFKNHKAYPIEVYLRTRTSKEAVLFMIKIPDAEGLREEAFNKVIDDVREATGLKVLKGSFNGPSHRSR